MRHEPPSCTTWTFKKSDNTDVYPLDTDLEICETAEGVYCLKWGEHWIDGLHQRGKDRKCLHHKKAQASDSSSLYEVRIDCSDDHLEAEVKKRRPNRNDPGDLTGVWGADAKHV